jgi:multimeric flavodoxin WrbA
MQLAQQQHDAPGGPARFLLINCSSRNEHTCPGEMSKSYRLLELARDALTSSTSAVPTPTASAAANPSATATASTAASVTAAGIHVEVLDLSRLTAEYGRKILPCKSCFSTAAALCHWPCSCYPNYSLGQTQDWMNDIYPLWVAAHGIMIISPVNWFQASSPLKLMMDRLVCADGGNPDPTTTHGKDAQEAKTIELDGWDYPRHLKGRVFACVVHGDTEGAENAGHSISDWLTSMELTAAAELNRYIGYWKPYATSHQELDADEAVQEEVRNAARALLQGVQATRSGLQIAPGADLKAPRGK